MTPVFVHFMLQCSVESKGPTKFALLPQFMKCQLGKSVFRISN